MQAKKEEKKSSYGLFIMLRSLEPILILETDNYDEAFERWKELKSQWATSVKESLPFELTSPIVTAFDPNLIYEITIKPVVETTANKHHNPYKKAMLNKGLSNTLGNSSMLSDIKDGGYL